MEKITPGVYRKRNGDTVTVERIDGDGMYPVRSLCNRSWARNGRYNTNSPNHPFDLIERVGDLRAAAPAPAVNPARDERRDALAIEYSKIMLARDGTCNPIDAVRYADAMLAALRGAA